MTNMKRATKGEAYEEDGVIWTCYSDDSGGSGTCGFLDSDLESDGNSNVLGEVVQMA